MKTICWLPFFIYWLVNKQNRWQDVSQHSIRHCCCCCWWWLSVPNVNKALVWQNDHTAQLSDGRQAVTCVSVDCWVVWYQPWDDHCGSAATMTSHSAVRCLTSVSLTPAAVCLTAPHHAVIVMFSLTRTRITSKDIMPPTYSMERDISNTVIHISVCPICPYFKNSAF